MWRCLLEEGRLTLWPRLSLLLVPMHAPTSPCPAPARPSSFSIRRLLLQQGPWALRVTSPPRVKLMLFQLIPSTWHQIPSAADSHAHDYIRILRGTCIWKGGQGVIYFFFFTLETHHIISLSSGLCNFFFFFFFGHTVVMKDLPWSRCQTHGPCRGSAEC